MAKKIKLSEYLAQAPVVENLKNFTGIDAANAVGMMTPERLAAVAGALIGKGLSFKGIIADCNTVFDLSVLEAAKGRSVNTPDLDRNFFVLTIPLREDNCSVQFAMEYNSAQWDIYYRHNFATSWAAWKVIKPQ